ncbi:hypothetical protein ADL22_12245 [Streptomyces sp. NRRL F-4489]|nr:hypothetical protein ADL22_12245 [Streptomyces sp. NRRL F-4489]
MRRIRTDSSEVYCVVRRITYKCGTQRRLRYGPYASLASAQWVLSMLYRDRPYEGPEEVSYDHHLERAAIQWEKV